MTAPVRAFVLGVVCCAAALVAATLAFGSPIVDDDVRMVLAFASALLVVQLLPIPFPRGSQMELIGLEEAVVVPLVLMLEPGPALVATTLGVLAGQFRGSRPNPLKAAFNTAQLVLAVGAALLVTWLASGSTAPGYGAPELLAATLGLVAMFVVNQLLVAGVMRLAAGTPIRRSLNDDRVLKVGMWVANAAIGALLVLPAIEAPGLLLVALVPLAMLNAGWRVHADRARDEQRLNELGSAVGGMSGELSIERVARALADSARDVVDATGARVRLVGDDREFWVRRSGDEIESGERHGSDPDGIESSSRASFSVPLVNGDGVFGELSVWNERRNDAAPRSFSRRDRTLLEMLGHQASSTLTNAVLSARATVQQQTIAQVFEHSSEGMLVLDSRGRVRGWNPAMQSISGFGLNTVDASPISLISPQLASIVDELTPGTIDAVVATADGERRHVRASYAPIDVEEHDGGDPATEDDHRWVVVVRDVTLEQETERLKDDFVATVSHELRTPLTAIKGFLETMQREDIVLGAGQVRMFLQIMGEQADRLERLIGDLLDMSAIESGRPLEVAVSPIDLTSSIERAIRTFRAARPNAVVSFEDRTRGLVVAADSHRLEQVATNLLDNALKHGGSEHPISVRIDRDDAGRARIEVTDRGRGISSVDQRRIFERFFVTKDSVTRNGGGAGLGLYICRRIVEAMHAEIHVDSTVGVGTTFSISFPVVAESVVRELQAEDVEFVHGDRAAIRVDGGDE